uniref:Putative P-loop containing nucleoside triphosphate hydrolase n=1 Tax=Helianthus annuus TaxID=4232 RepID=A0A251S6C9_HELAN
MQKRQETKILADMCGKLIDFNYNAKGMLHGACIHTLLLEKSRISQLSRSERSYHVFYQLCAGASSDMREQCRLQSM